MSFRRTGAQLTIDLGALADNWRNLAARCQSAETAAVVKANAYGIGIDVAVPALWAAGCRTFFVAVPAEGVAVRAAAPDAIIYVLDGFFSADAALYRDHDLRPVLGNPDEFRQWAEMRHESLAAIHVDTGMNRLGLTRREAALLSSDNRLEKAGVTLLLSHLAAADTPDNYLNTLQQERFAEIRAFFPGIPASLANSAGIFLSPDTHMALTRPGIALYGGASHPEGLLRPVVTAEAPVIQIRDILPGETVGYGGAETMQQGGRIAILAAGYGDGYPRAAGARDGLAGAEVAISGRIAPLVGRVSMDMMAVDISEFAQDEVHLGDTAELFGKTIAIDAVAKAAGTIGYEVLTSLGQRYVRNAIGAES